MNTAKSTVISKMPRLLAAAAMAALLSSCAALSPSTQAESSTPQADASSKLCTKYIRTQFGPPGKGFESVKRVKVPCTDPSLKGK